MSLDSGSQGKLILYEFSNFYRGSSANWKHEECTPSTSKPYNHRQLNLGDTELSNTKKAIEFKSGKSTGGKSKDKKKFK